MRTAEAAVKSAHVMHAKKLKQPLDAAVELVTAPKAERERREG